MVAMGLDMIFVAGETGKFVRRVGGFLGPHALVFPRESIIGRQPIVEVADVIKHLYEFRNLIAHGKEIPKSPYREPYRLQDHEGGAITLEDYRYFHLLEEAGLFMLASTLRRIFTEGLFDKVKAEKQWKRQLTVYEHRYNNQLPNGRREAPMLVLRALQQRAARA